ncbi:MOSC domain-containing protein [Methylomonas methanica]|uniref:MOSC domain protein beta barrel domain protein n=1 Tax=Methylomonas methanica (strain DSM 25384 / MC09) TaxID=857087 RepID=G0A7E9_METMM|nr:MOSC N-terminal beta barrel domain-containing protein [Methylomonas methanica]AEG00619.1 MOSC domain protein beta barrel domain protein [Methylomonas methanica MC09]
MPVLSQIYIYPVKSLAGIAVTEWPVDSNGLRFDRKWMLIDAQQQFLSQRSLPQMALIKPHIEGDCLILSAPNQPELELPLHPTGGDEVEVGIWHDRCLAKSVSPAADEWFSRFLQTDCRLVYHPDEQIRQVDQRYAQPADQTAFSDGFPFLIISENSLNALNQLLDAPVSMLRFRPNLVVTDCDSHAEDHWRQIKINNIAFRLPKPCSRCAVPGIDPETAVRNKEPLATLNRIRRWENKLYFGQNALHDKAGTLSVGDWVDILESGEKQPPLP